MWSDFIVNIVDMLSFVLDGFSSKTVVGVTSGIENAWGGYRLHK